MTKSKKINWTDEQKEWIKQHSLEYFDYELAKLFNEKFGTNHPMSTIRSFRQRLKVSKPKYKHDGRLLESDKIHYTTPQQEEWLKSNFNESLSRIQLTKMFNDQFNTCLNIREVQYMCLKNGLAYRHTYSQEQEDWLKNNAKKFKNSKDLTKEFNNRFNTSIRRNNLLDKLSNLGDGFLKQKGMKTGNELTIGTIRKTIDGKKDRYIIKTKNGWEECGRYYYKQYYGEIPKDHHIYFLDGDNTNFAKENLIAISKSDVGTLRALYVNDKINYFNQGIYTKAMVEIIQTEKLLYKE